jgi:uncharacterized protein (DUF1800 family)
VETARDRTAARACGWGRAARYGLAACVAFVLAACGGADKGSADAPPASDKPASRIEAHGFLTQATFGPTEASLSRVSSIGYSAWINEQVARPQTSHRAYWDAADAALKAVDAEDEAGSREIFDSFYRQAITGEDQLRQRIAFALSQIFVISLQDGNVNDHPRGVASYMDMLATHAFGNYRNLLQDVSTHPMMGLYLSHLRNQKENAATGRVPDENYAREVMQLFSIGLHQLELDGTVKTDGAGKPLETYTAEDIAGLAKVFTGFSWAGPDTSNSRFYGNGTPVNPNRTIEPMQGYKQFHSVSEKRFLGRTIAAVAAADADPAGDLSIAMDTLFQHPNVGPFIGRQLIQRLVTSNPSPAYVSRVAQTFNNNGSGVRGDMLAVVRAVLLDPEARGDASSNRFGKLREPVLRLTAYLRAFGAASDSGRWLIETTDDPGTQLGQSPMRSPSVFNFYRPGYVPPGSELGALGLAAPEMQITHESSVAGYVNFMRGVVQNGVGRRGVNYNAPRNDVQVNWANELALFDKPAELVQRMDDLLLGGRMSSALEADIVQAVESINVPALRADGSNQSQVDTAKRNRVQAAAFLTLASPEFIVQK